MSFGRMMAAVVAAAAAGWVMTACAPKDRSPVIACELDGKVVSTDFTFNSFRTTLALEHGSIEVVTNASLKSKSLQVYFKPLADGRLLAERVVVLGSLQGGMTPAVLFGLTNAVALDRPGEAVTMGLVTNTPADDGK